MLGVSNSSAEKRELHMWCGGMYVVISGVLQKGKWKFSHKQFF